MTKKKAKMEMKKVLRKSMIWFIGESIWQQRSQGLQQRNFITVWRNGQHHKWITDLSQQVPTSYRHITRDNKHRSTGPWWSANQTWPRSARRNWCSASVSLILRGRFAMISIFGAILDLYHFSSASKKNRISPKIEHIQCIEKIDLSLPSNNTVIVYQLIHLYRDLICRIKHLKFGAAKKS